MGKNRNNKEDNNWCNFKISAGKFQKLKIKIIQQFVQKMRRNELALQTGGGVHIIESTFECAMRTNKNSVICTKNKYK